ncbi:MAG: hypothetical protein ACREMP_08310 [Candidatus Tyrphobacter sp.]
MKTLAVIVAFAMVLAVQARAFAQETTPTPDPLTYDDPAMHYEAPAGAVLLSPMQHVALSDLSQDPTAVATWAVGRGEDAKFISIIMESYTGDLDGFDSTYENSLRESDPATLVKHKEHALLANGMPALFLDVTQGAGFSTRKVYAYIWIDSQRAVVLTVQAHLGALDEASAKQLLAGATAVRYPTDQP